MSKGAVLPPEATPPPARLLFAACPRAITTLVLWLSALVYFAAFFSLYVQVPGLYARNGLLPVEPYLQRQVGGQELYAEGSVWELMRAHPTALWLLVRGVDLPPDVGMEVIALCGTVLAFAAVFVEALRTKTFFALLWLGYFSLVQAGQTFLWFQWDSLMLELGALVLFLAPWFPLSRSPAHDPAIPLALLRWLLFRLVFASGVVKLTSMCPTWWDLSALYWHFESQCIPMPLAWYARLLPAWMMRAGVAATYLFLMGGGVCALLPCVPALRLVGCLLSIALQLLILLTGNYNFFNVVTIVLSLPMLVDDLAFERKKTSIPASAPPAPNTKSSARTSSSQASTPSSASSSASPSTATSHPSLAYRVVNTLSLLLSFVLLAAAVWMWCVLFDAGLGRKSSVEEGNSAAAAAAAAHNFLSMLPELHTRVAFSQEDFTTWVDLVTLPLIFLGGCALMLSALLSLVAAARARHYRWYRLLSTTFAVALGVFLFLISTVPFSSISPYASERLPAQVTSLFEQTQALQLTHSYGLFRRMTGVGGRPEVVVELTRDLHTWEELDFKYKVNGLDTPPPMVIPHQPRLDWQMWFAALGSFEHNPWLVNLAIKVMHQSPPVLRLLPASARSAVLHRPPVAVRMKLYKYHYTSNTSSPAWWWREEDNVYMTRLDRTNPWCDKFLQHYGFHLPVQPPTTGTEDARDWLIRLITGTRTWMERAGDALSARFGEDLFVMLLFWGAFVAKLLGGVAAWVAGKRRAGSKHVASNGHAEQSKLKMS